LLLKRIAFLFSLRNLKLLAGHFFQALGGLWLLIELSKHFFPRLDAPRPTLLIGVLLISLLWSLARSFPPQTFRRRYRASNVEIEISVGDILKEHSHIAFGVSECFDTEPEVVIGGGSLMAQMVRHAFSGNHTLLDGAISDALRRSKLTARHDPDKDFGKPNRYPIGSVAIIEVNSRKVFLTAFSVTNADGTTTTSKDNLWSSLSQLWSEFVRVGQTEPLAVPVLGSGISRVQASRISLIQLLILSFVIATRERVVSRHLKIVIYENDYDPVEMAEAIELIKTLDF
jgi:hypothetical protein